MAQKNYLLVVSHFQWSQKSAVITFYFSLMCLNPLSIRNPTKAIVNNGGQALRLSVPCGHCAQCKQAKRNEWFIRTHYEIKRTHASGGYVYFDTLTYDDANLPKLSNFIDIEKYEAITTIIVIIGIKAKTKKKAIFPGNILISG